MTTNDTIDTENVECQKYDEVLEHNTVVTNVNMEMTTNETVDTEIKIFKKTMNYLIMTLLLIL